MKAAIINIVSIICFTVLAIYFHHWWIVLFSSFFLFQETYHTEKNQKHESERREKENDIL